MKPEERARAVLDAYVMGLSRRSLLKNIAEAIREAALEEREACAAVAEAQVRATVRATRVSIAKRIRGRPPP